MKAKLYIDSDHIGDLELSVIDESMGALGGCLVSNQNYKYYQTAIQRHYEVKGISNIHDFNYKMRLDDDKVIVAEGGIGVTDSVEFKEIYVDIAGVDFSTL